MRKLFILLLGFGLLTFSSSCQIINRGFNSHSDKIGKADTLFHLDKILVESSALCYWNNIFWSLNDSGGDACLYGFDRKNGKLLHIIRINNTKNIDWEGLCQDKHFFYIGDFGNNYGNRKDLQIIRVRKPDTLAKKEISIEGEFIAYYYPDQKNFSIRKHKNKWDCESIFYQNDSLYVITKNWISGISSIYALPSKPGKYAADKKATFNAEGLITDAALSTDGKTLYLIGYRDYIPYISVIDNYSATKLNKANIKRYEFITLAGTQTEGLCILENNLYFSCEKSKFNPASLFIVKH